MSKRLAVIPAKGLGDGLMTMVVAHNLSCSGYLVDFYSDVLSGLKEFFPKVKLAPLANLKAAPESLKQYDRVFMFDAVVPDFLENLAQAVYWRDYRRRVLKTQHVVKRFKAVLEAEGFAWQTFDNGLKVPSQLTKNTHPKRICIHPTSTDKNKNWLPQRFKALALQLKQSGFTPVFILAPNEKSAWQKKMGTEYDISAQADLAKVAEFLYQSAMVIGNDSGVGHLGANLGLKTLSIFSSEKRAKVWRPLWGENQVVLPNALAKMKLLRRYWFYFLSVRRVYTQFKKLYDF